MATTGEHHGHHRGASMTVPGEISMALDTFHRWLRTQRLSWPGVMPRSGVKGIGGTNRSNSQDLWIGDVSA